MPRRTNLLPLIALLLGTGAANASPARRCHLEENYVDSDSVVIASITAITEGVDDGRGTTTDAVAFDVILPFKGAMARGQHGSFQNDHPARGNFGFGKGMQPFFFVFSKGKSYLLTLKDGRPVSKCGIVADFDSETIHSLIDDPPAHSLSGIEEALLLRTESAEVGVGNAMRLLLQSKAFEFIAGKSQKKNRFVAAARRYVEQYGSEKNIDWTRAGDLASAKQVLNTLALDEKMLADYTNNGALALARGDWWAAKGDFETLVSLDPENETAKRGYHGVIEAMRNDAPPGCPIGDSRGEGLMYMRGNACRTTAGRIECPDLAFPRELDEKGITQANLTLEVDVSSAGIVNSKTARVTRSSNYPWFDKWALEYVQTQCEFTHAAESIGMRSGEIEVEYDPYKFTHLRTKRAHKVR